MLFIIILLSVFILVYVWMSEDRITQLERQEDMALEANTRLGLENQELRRYIDMLEQNMLQLRTQVTQLTGVLYRDEMPSEIHNAECSNCNRIARFSTTSQAECDECEIYDQMVKEDEGSTETHSH